MNEHANDSFRAQVGRLVAEGKLTPEEAAGLLEGEERVVDTVSPREAAGADAALAGETPPDLDLQVHGYSLTVLHDPSVMRPQLSANYDGEVTLTATSNGWRVDRAKRRDGLPVKAILSLPFAPRHVQARIHGGTSSFPTSRERPTSRSTAGTSAWAARRA